MGDRAGEAEGGKRGRRDAGGAFRPRSDKPFMVCLLGFAGFYVLLIVGMLGADLQFRRIASSSGLSGRHCPDL